jgi:hypothetical protein
MTRPDRLDPTAPILNYRSYGVLTAEGRNANSPRPAPRDAANSPSDRDLELFARVEPKRGSHRAQLSG